MVSYNQKEGKDRCRFADSDTHFSYSTYLTFVLWKVARSTQRALYNWLTSARKTQLHIKM